MANNSVNELDGIWERMRALAAERDITFVTAQAPRQQPSSMPQIENNVIIVDYISVLNKGTFNGK